MRVLVTGGAGYIGSHTVELLLLRGHEVYVYDNLPAGHLRAVPANRLIEGDLGDISRLDQLFVQHRLEAVLHFAAFASVGESVRHPAKYYQNNLVNTLNLPKPGHLGTDQLEFVEKDVAGLSSDTPNIVFSHIPLFAMYPQWSWGTDYATQALRYLRRFSSVTCLNGHVHQLFTKTEGNVTFYSATTTAYPLPHPGQGPGPIPVTLPAGRLGAALGVRDVTYQPGQHALAVRDRRLS